MAIRTNHVFKGHRTLLGNKFVTYAEVELPVKYELFSKSKSGFDWGNSGSSSIQLSFSMLHQLSDESFASEFAKNFCNDVVSKLASRDWILNTSDIVDWIEKNSPELVLEEKKSMDLVKPPKKTRKKKTNVVKEICKTLAITQKSLAEILEVPEGTVSSWAVKNEIPRLGKKAIEFYILNRINQEVVDSYKNFVKLLQSA